MSQQLYIPPPYLSVGQCVAITAPASKVTHEAIAVGVAMLQQAGFEVIVGKTIGTSYHDFAATDAERQQELQAFLDDTSIAAIFAARGGYGCSRILDSLNFDKFLQFPKWIIGFSDLTALHGKIQQLGYQSIHGPMPKSMGNDLASDQSLLNALKGQSIDYQVDRHELNRDGVGEGALIGGNLCILLHALGTASEIDFHGKILFLEDVGEKLYNLDRMMVQLKRAGKLSHLVGLVVGQFSDCKESDEPFGKTAYEIIAEHTESFGYPVAYNFPIGHTEVNWAVRCGEVMRLEVTEQNSRLISQPFHPFSA